MRLQDSASEIDQLKQLLIADEIEKLEQLEDNLKRLSFESDDEAHILQRVTPLFDAMLLESLKDKGDETVRIFSDHISRIITRASEENSVELSRALQSTITPVIVEAIDSNKEKMIDTLYPILGGMISKYVSQALKEFIESINEKVEDGLSFDRYRRKVKAKVSGVSESELLLQESAQAHVSSLFIVHKQSGLLISEAHLRDNEISDAHMVASMASAIKDFINDWIQQSQEHTEIEILSYGNATLYIDSAGSVYIIAFLDHVPNHELRSDINSFFASLLSEHSDLFQSFDGDDSTEEVSKLSEKMQQFLDQQKPISDDGTVHSTRPVRYLALFLGVLLLFYVGYRMKHLLFEYQLSSEIKTQTGHDIEIASSYDEIVLHGSVGSFEEAAQIEGIVSRYSDVHIEDELTMPITIVGKIIKQGEGYAPLGTTQLDKRLDQIEKQMKRLQKIEKLTSIRRKMVDRLVKRLHGTTQLDPMDGSLHFSSNAFFAKGSSELKAEFKGELQNTFERYIEALSLDPDSKRYLDHIIIEGHTDSDGTYEFNLDLSYRRALAVMEFLQTLDVIEKYDLKGKIHAAGRADQELVFDGSFEDKKASRRITVGFGLKDAQLLTKIADIVHER